jgi:membrane protease YdiL (CAAX protease family)
MAGLARFGRFGSNAGWGDETEHTAELYFIPKGDPIESPAAKCWSVRNAIFCMVWVFLSELIVFGTVWGIWVLYPKIGYWVRTPFGTMLYQFTRHVFILVFVMFLTQTRTARSFLREFELAIFPKSGVILFGLLGGVTAMASMILLTRYCGQPPQAETLLTHFRGATVTQAICVTMLLAYTAFIEEVALRGYIYKSFRNSWGILPSVIAVVLLSVFAHWNVVTKSPVIFAKVAIISALLCIFREKKNLWNCIAFHVAWNVTVCWVHFRDRLSFFS